MGKWPHLTCLGRTTQKSCSWEATAAALQNFLPWDMFMSQKHKITGDSNCICIDPDGISQPLHTLGFLMENYWETSMKWNKFCSTVIFQKRKMDCNTVGKKIWRRKWNRPKDVIFFYILDLNSIIQFDSCTQIKQKYFFLTLTPSLI